MALVAYSDDSDLGTDTEDGEEPCEEVAKKQNGQKNVEPRDEQRTSTKASPVLQDPKDTVSVPNEGIDSIIDEDEDIVRPKDSGMFASIPEALPLTNDKNVPNQDDDELTDVPTVDTWKVIQELKKSDSDGGSSSNHQSALENSLRQKKKERRKVQFFVPALTEFEEEEEPEEPKQKKMKPSSSGSGLFSLLPDPKHLTVKETKRSLVPNILTKKPAPEHLSNKKQKREIKDNIGNIGADISVSDEEDNTGLSDFFSLSEPTFDISQHPPQYYQVQPEVLNNEKQKAVQGSNNQPNTVLNNEEQEAVGVLESHPGIVLNNEQEEAVGASENQPNIDAEAMVRLAGKRRGKDEVINFIDVSADDALLTRQEWMTKALTEEKPTHGFSKKREGLPSQKQKQKHQITYLAHQAKERELELKNNWAQNRMTKMQTQAKYGF